MGGDRRIERKKIASCEIDFKLTNPSSRSISFTNGIETLDLHRRISSEFEASIGRFLPSRLNSTLQVFDEADMLLCGSFQNQVIRLINMFRFDEKILSRAKKSSVDTSLDMESESSIQVDLEDMQDDEDIEEETDYGNSFEESEQVIVKKRDWKRKREIFANTVEAVEAIATVLQGAGRI